MLIPRVDDATYSMECLGTVFVVSTFIEPVEGCITGVDGLVGRCLFVSLYGCEEIFGVVGLRIGPDIEIKPCPECID